MKNIIIQAVLAVSVLAGTQSFGAPNSQKASGMRATTGEDRSQEDREARMAWWRKARFGMFVHWGLYSIPAGEWKDRQFKRGGVEWIQKNANISADEYEKTLIPQFKPKEDFAKEWAETAEMAGCKYLVFTSIMKDSRCTIVGKLRLMPKMPVDVIYLRKLWMRHERKASRSGRIIRSLTGIIRRPMQDLACPPSRG